VAPGKKKKDTRGQKRPHAKLTSNLSGKVKGGGPQVETRKKRNGTRNKRESRPTESSWATKKKK